MKLYLSKFILPISSESFEDGALLVHKDRIRDLGKASELFSKYPKAEKIDLGDTILLPGLVNPHCHLELSHAPLYNPLDYVDPSGEPNFIRWLIALSQYQDSLTAPEKRDAIQEGLKNLRATGTTTVGDLTTYEGALRCYEESSLRVVGFPEVMNLNRKNAQDRFESALGFVDEIMHADHPRIRAGLAPYAPYTLSKNLLKIFYQHLKTLKIPVQIHTSQSFAEMEFFYDSKGDIANILFPYVGWGEHLPPPYQKTPIQYLHSIEFLQVRPALVGCVHMGPTDLALISKSGSSIVYSPRVNKTLRLGQASLRKILEHKIPVALASDSLACNQNLSLWEEMQEVFNTNSAAERIRTEEILAMATWGGAYTLGLEKEIGSLEKGKLADFIVIKTPPDIQLSHLAEWLVQTNPAPFLLKKIVGGEEIV